MPESPWADGRAPRSPRWRPLLPSPFQAGVQGGLRGPAGMGAGGGRPEAAWVRRAQRAACCECPGALPGTTSSRKPSLTAPPAAPFPKAQLLPSLQRHSCVREPWLGRGLSLSMSQIPPGPRAVGKRGWRRHGVLDAWVGAHPGGGGWSPGPGCWSQGLRQPAQHSPQAEAAGNLEVVALLQSLRGGAGDQVLGAVRPLPAVVRCRWGWCPGAGLFKASLAGGAHRVRGAAVSGWRASQRDG